MSAATLPSASEWISAAEASRLLGFRTEKPVTRLAAAGHLTYRRLPCGRARYLLSDLLKVAENNTHPAKVSHATGMA